MDVTVIWIDWYSYHFARFRALLDHPCLAGGVSGVELVGRSGVHHGLTFRDSMRCEPGLSTLKPESSWHEESQFGLARSLWQKLNELNPKTVLVPGYYTIPGLAAAVWARWNRRRSLLMTESGEQDSSRRRWKEWFKRKLIHILFDSAIAGGRAHADYLAKLGVESTKIGRYYDVVDNWFFSQGTDSLRRSSAPEEHNLPTRYFLYVGRLAAEKNLSCLIRAFAQYRSEGGNWSLVLAGGGPLEDDLRRECAANGVERLVHFAGMKRTAELIPYYSFASCFVLASSREPWGLVVNEAMASGLPVLISKRCGCTELVSEGGNGLLFDPDSESDLAGSMFWMSSLNSVRRNEMGQRSREIISQYSPENFASEVVRAIGISGPQVSAAA